MNPCYRPIVMDIVVVSIYYVINGCYNLVWLIGLTASASVYWLQVISETLLVNVVFMHFWNSKSIK